MRSLREIQDDLAAAERRLAQVKAWAATATSTLVSQDIGNQLGRVVVNALGGLQSVELDPEGLAYTNGRALGRAVVAAVRAAEDKARARREEVLG
ncbi:YbaB/EbfC family nucleoid-associated protein [Crossiella sp. NPDC003009]